MLVRRSPGAEPERAYVLTEVIGPVRVGDEIVINTTAVELSLGTGGWHPVHWNLSRASWSTPGPGHIMKLRYTSEQIDAGSAEEHDSLPHHLDRMPVVVCMLHSQIAPVAAAIKTLAPHLKIAYVMTDQAALPFALSDLIDELREKELIEITFSSGQCFGAQHEAVNVTSALGLAKAKGADIAIVAQGPGVVGTNSEFGFSGLESAAHLNSVHQYNGRPIFALRYSEADERARHQGVSHQAVTVLKHCAVPVDVAAPDNLIHELGTGLLNHTVTRVDIPDMAEVFQRFDLSVTTMGRSIDDDRAFFDFAAAAGALGARSLMV